MSRAVGASAGWVTIPAQLARVDVCNYFMVRVPFAKSLDPVTKTNWEGTGVTPDVCVAAKDALETAQKLALDKIQAAKKKESRAAIDRRELTCMSTFSPMSFDCHF